MAVIEPNRPPETVEPTTRGLPDRRRPAQERRPRPAPSPPIVPDEEPESGPGTPGRLDVFA